MSSARLAAALVAAIALASVLGQYAILTQDPAYADATARIWHLAKFFTILTNALIGVLMALVALNRHPGDGALAGGLLSILMVGIVYHALLAPETPLPGWDWWTDLGYHTLVPLGMLAWWLIWGGKRLRWGQLPYWLLWPLGYCVYAMIRGGIEGDYPYFFLDVGRFGAPRIAMNIAGLVVVFALMGALILLAARLLHRPARD